MRKLLCVLVCIGLFIPSVRAQSESLNGTLLSTQEKREIAPPLECKILDPQFRTVTEVRESFNAINPYWLSFTNNTGQTPSQVTFEVTFNPDSPLVVQSQVFIPGDDTGIRTPFGVPFWAMGRTRGPATLTVDAEDLGKCSYDFRVIAH